MQNNTNKRILMMAYVFAGLFLVLIGFIGKYVALDSKDIITSPYNKRQDMFAKSVIRGELKSSDDKVLAESKVAEDGTVTRSYPYGNIFAHVIGFDTNGKSGLESVMNYNLLTSNANFFERFYNTLSEKKNKGDTVVTTLDSRLQKAAYDSLGNHRGAVVVMEPSTGKILAMVSKPDFDPNEIEEQWKSITSDDDTNHAVLLNRATQGIYPPGSIFKILTALAYMQEDKNNDSYQYTCKGKTIINNVSISCYDGKIHGKQDLTSSFAHSCNTSFANIGTLINPGRLYSLCENFLFNQDLPLNLPYQKSSFVLNSSSDKSAIPQTVIGQGDTGITPIHSAMITAAIANGGVMMTPYLVDHIENYEGILVKKYTGKAYKKDLLTSAETRQLTKLMESVVKEGTATALNNSAYTAAGKTGSAEFAEGKNAHAWFTGFAPVKNPEIVVSVIVENVGAGSTYAVPIAKRILDTYFTNK